MLTENVDGTNPKFWKKAPTDTDQCSYEALTDVKTTGRSVGV